MKSARRAQHHMARQLEPHPAEINNAHSSAFRITSVIDVALSGLSLLLLLGGWAYVVVHRRRPLCALRIALGLTATLWVLGFVASHGAIWSVAQEFVDSSQSERWDREQLCGLHAAVTLGFAEPASLLLIASLIRAKTLPRHGAHPSWRLVRRSLGQASLLAMLQALVVALPLSGARRHSVVLEPLPPVLNASDGAALDREVWWRDDEGCANSIASVGVSTVRARLPARPPARLPAPAASRPARPSRVARGAYDRGVRGRRVSSVCLSVCQLFVVPFELYWTLSCYRLLGLIVNIRLKARLYCVQVRRALHAPSTPPSPSPP